MRTAAITAARLDRQKSLISTIRSRTEDRQKAGENVELSLSLLRGEGRLYRRMLGQAPLDVLEEHAHAARST